MAICVEKISLPPGQPFCLLRWQGHSSELTLLTESLPRIVPGWGARWHSHSELEFTIVRAGRGMRYVGDHAAPFTALDCVLLGPSLPHCWVPQGEYSGYLLHFRFPLDHGIWRLGYETELHALFEGARCGLQFDERVASVALPLLERLVGATALARIGLLLELFGLLRGVVMRREAVPLSSCDYSGAQGAAVSPRLEAVMQWMLDHFREPIRLDEAWHRAGMSRATFARQFRKHTNKTFYEFLNDVRITYAHQRLTSTRHSVAEIAFEAGFNSLSHFGALFLSRYGITPRQCGRGRILTLPP